MAQYVVDTHALLFFLANSPKLGKKAASALADPDSTLVLPVVALAEALWIVSSRRLGVSSAELLAAIDGDPRFVIHDLTREVVELAQSLTRISEMHDRQIAATAILLSEGGEPTFLLTKDADVTESGLASVAW
jgi:PIN domain nuclease of toxin-antitoxin system